MHAILKPTKQSSYMQLHEIVIDVLFCHFSLIIAGQCLEDNFYVRGDSTLVYYFTEGICVYI